MVTSSAVVGSSAIKQVGLVGESHGDHDALALAARQLVGIGAETLLRLAHADLEQKLEHALAGARFIHVAMQLQYLAHLLLDGVQRVERGHRLLEDHGDAVAADRLQLRLGDLQEVAAFKPDLA